MFPRLSNFFHHHYKNYTKYLIEEDNDPGNNYSQCKYRLGPYNYTAPPKKLNNEAILDVFNKLMAIVGIIISFFTLYHFLTDPKLTLSDSLHKSVSTKAKSTTTTTTTTATTAPTTEKKDGKKDSFDEASTTKTTNTSKTLRKTTAKKMMKMAKKTPAKTAAADRGGKTQLKSQRKSKRKGKAEEQDDLEKINLSDYDYDENDEDDDQQQPSSPAPAPEDDDRLYDETLSSSIRSSSIFSRPMDDSEAKKKMATLNYMTWHLSRE